LFVAVMVAWFKTLDVYQFVNESNNFCRSRRNLNLPHKLRHAFKKSRISIELHFLLQELSGNVSIKEIFHAKSPIKERTAGRR